MTQETTSGGRLIALLTAFLYALLTLLPNSHSLMVQWSWVFIWQMALFCPMLWLLALMWQNKELKALGNHFDWIIGLTLVGLLVSVFASEFRHQALWYSWSALGFIAALYALNLWLKTPKKCYYLLIAQGYLQLAFIVFSLVLWTSQTLFPELTRLRQLQSYGVTLSFDFSEVSLRNWAPLGHQNYVAGYLLLALPLLVGLSIRQRGWQRKIWLIGVGLGIVALYTTSSRGGWLGLLILAIVALIVLFFCSGLPKKWLLWGGIGGLATLILLILANNRLRTLIFAVLHGRGGGELAYRLINAEVGWRMGITHPLTGVGLGNVPVLYQKYRPFWAGRESETIYQLHSTPVQLWAELGIWGILAGVGASILLIYALIHWLNRPQPTSNAKSEAVLIWSIYGALLAYGVMSLTDFQLDNLAISGTLVIYLACLASLLASSEQKPLISPPIVFYSFYAGIGILLAGMIWLFPINRAWQLSSQGFSALRQEKMEPFTTLLSTAHQLAPWEPYYSYQLGWQLGDNALNTSDPQLRQSLVQQAIPWFEKGNQASPYQEFGTTNLGWLSLQNQSPSAATPAFIQSAELIPAKRGVFYGLGISLLLQNRPELAIEALTLEALRDPLFVTSPLWRIPLLQPVYGQVLTQLVDRYTTLLQDNSLDPTLKMDLHGVRGSIYWWLGDFDAAQADWEKAGISLTQPVLQLSLAKPVSGDLPLILQAWTNPTQRRELIAKAWVQETKTAIPEAIATQLEQSMAQSSTFSEWIQVNAPIHQYRRQRLGFGINMRHLDGVTPSDFLVVADNIVVNTWFSALFPSPVYFPQWDHILQPWREALIEKIQ